MREVNGFSLTQTLMVLFIVCLLMKLTPAVRHPSLGLLMDRLCLNVCKAQMEAYAAAGSRRVEIQENQVVSDTAVWNMPAGTVCTPAVISFNANGSPSKAGSLVCQDGYHRARLVWQLGSGRIRWENLDD